MKASVELYLGITGLNIFIDNFNNITEVASAAFGAELFQLCTDQSVSNTECSPMENIKNTKWSNITTTEVKKFLGLIILFGQVEKVRLT
jgi:hypothetical protein